ncbi:89_t:CDS:2 [Funneliformis mosseae]|uniref:89_t:CDS:1 n=1 Tax=Funneliformis mosseae TaxID=27381 RepID=A0A9N9AMC4_FUNMO|nr:89_t:CDS:2 [Funneliformis mosseae]
MEYCKPYRWNIKDTSSLISTSAEALKTAIGNINYTIDNSTPESIIGRKRACENEELPSISPNKTRIGPNLPTNIFLKKNKSSTTETGEKSPAKSNLEERDIKSNGKKITDKELMR